MQDDNPYAPPSLEEPEVHQEHAPWYLAMRGIYVRNGEELPEVDLVTGGTENLVPSRKTVKVGNPRTIKWLILGPALMVGALSALDVPEPWSIGGPVVAALVIHRIFEKRIHFTLHCDAGLELKRKRVETMWRGIRITAAGILLALFYFLGSSDHLVMLLFAFAGVMALLNRMLIIRVGNLEMREASGMPGWARIGNAHPAAMEKLAAIETAIRTEKETPDQR